MPSPNKVYRLNDLEVQEVSLVDTPANQRKFLMVKNVAGADEVVGKLSDRVNDAMAEDAAETTELSIEIHPDVQKQYGDTLDALGKRCIALSASVRAAKTIEAEAATVPPRLAEEVALVMSVFAGLAAAEGTSKKADKAEDDKDDKDAKRKAPPGKQPPSLKGGDEDEEPRANPKKADALLESVAKLAELDLNDEATRKLALAAAREALYCAADCAHGDQAKSVMYAQAAIDLLVAHFGLTKSDAIVAKAESIAKEGKKMAGTRFKEFDKSLRALLDLAEQIEPGYLQALSKSDDTGSTRTIESLVRIIETKDAEIKTLKGGGRPAPNTVPAGESAASGEGFRWPQDLNADYEKNPDLSFD